MTRRLGTLEFRSGMTLGDMKFLQGIEADDTARTDRDYAIMVLHNFLLTPKLAPEDFDGLSEHVLRRVVGLYLASAYPDVNDVTGSAVYTSLRSALRSEVEASLRILSRSAAPAVEGLRDMTKGLGISLQQLSAATSRIRDYKPAWQDLVGLPSRSYTSLPESIGATALRETLPAPLPPPGNLPRELPPLLEDPYADDGWADDGYDDEADDERWSKVDRQVERAWERLDDASAEEDFQSVGHLCREILISLADAVYVRERHPPLDDIEPSATDAKRRLQAYIAVELAGSSHKEARRSVRASVDFAVSLQHDRNATETEAAACVIATVAVVDVLRVIEQRA